MGLSFQPRDPPNVYPTKMAYSKLFSGFLGSESSDVEGHPTPWAFVCHTWN